MSSVHRVAGVFTVLTILISACDLLNAYPPGWSDDILISPQTAGYSDYPDLVTDNQNNVWVAWDSAGWTGGYIYCTKRDSLGNCLIPETEVSPSGYSRYVRIEADAEDNIHFVWRALSYEGYGLGYAKFANNGAVVVSPHLVVSGTGGGGPIAMEIAIDVWDDIRVIWEETEVTQYVEQINYTLLNSNGDTLVSKLTVSPPDTNCYYPSICVDSAGNNHILFRANCPPFEWLMYTKVDKYGNIIVPNSIVTQGTSPSLVCDNSGNLHVFFKSPAGSGNSIYYTKLNNSGNIMVNPVCVSVPYYSSWQCHVAIDSDQYLHTVWDENRSREFAWIVYTKMDTLGNVVIPPLDIVFPPHTFWSIEARIAVDNNNRLHVVWIDGRIDTVAKIFYKRGENETGIEELPETHYETTAFSVTPNPFRHTTTVRHSVPRVVSMEIFDSSGRLVKAFDQVSTIEQPGSAVWDGTDNHGSRISSGVYFLHIQSPNGVQSIPVVLLR
ncbi:MAG: T9SS type A sorting domain-containing protein [candidate division WOR-3 bacterium]|nr:T9SS type A sorting domain-containing protein [candidate division WOR-3 bacterium]